jgi:hypothetical protein
MTLEQYNHWLMVSARVSRIRLYAPDLLQDCLAVALENGRIDLSQQRNERWFYGVLKRRAAELARTEVRRRKRDKATVPILPGETLHPDMSAVLPKLPKSARIVAVLVAHGMTRQEIVCALEITDASFRQRLAVLRRILLENWSELTFDGVAASPRFQELELGPIRHMLFAALQRRPGIGTHDPDGHLIIIRKNTAHKSSTRGN